MKWVIRKVKIIDYNEKYERKESYNYKVIYEGYNTKILPYILTGILFYLLTIFFIIQVSENGNSTTEEMIIVFICFILSSISFIVTIIRSKFYEDKVFDKKSTANNYIKYRETLE